MAKRTRRQRITYHAHKIPEHIARIMEDLAAITDIADGKSEWVNDMVPALAVLFEEADKLVAHFIDVL